MQQRLLTQRVKVSHRRHSGEGKEGKRRNTFHLSRTPFPIRTSEITKITAMSQAVETRKTNDSQSRLSRPHPFSVVSLMCDRGLQKPQRSSPPVTKSEHKFSVESLLQPNGSREQQGTATVREPVKCNLNAEERVIKDDFTSWLTTSRYNQASKY